MLNKTKLAAALSPPNSPLSITHSTASPTTFSTFPFKNSHNFVFNLPPINPPQQSTTPESTLNTISNTRFIATLQWKSKSTLTHDVDLVAILLNKYGGIHDVCFFNNLDQVKGLKHSGDDRNGFKNLDSNRMKEQLKDDTIPLEKAISDSNEYIELDLSQVDQEVRCIVFLASCYAGTVLSELSFASCNLYQYVNDQELKLAISSKLDNQRDVSGQVFAIIQLRGGDAEVISTSVVPGKEKENTNKDDDDDEGSAMDNSSISQSPGNSSHLKPEHENDETTQEDETSASVNSSYYWQIVSKQVDIGHNERLIDTFMYAMCKDVLPENIFISMKNRLTYIIHLRQEEKKNLNKENMAIANLLKDDDHDDDEEYIVRVYSELTGSILIDQLIVEEVHKYLSTVQVSAEKPPFIPTLKDEALLQEINAKKEIKPSEFDEEKKETEKPSIASQISMQKSYTFNEDRVKIFIGWQALSGRSYSRYYLTTTVLFFGKYGTRLGHIDQYTPKLSLARIENHTNTASTAGNSSSSIANDKPSVGNNSPRNATSNNAASSNTLSTSSHAIKPTPAAVFYKDNLFESGKENDLCAEIDLTRLPKSVHSIMVVVTASSNAQDSGFQELKDPFVKISTPSVGDLYRYQFNTSDKAHQSFIACKLTCLRNPNESSGINFTSKKNQINSMVSSGSFIGLTKWKISNIGEYSYGVHPLIDPKLKAQIQSYVTTIDLPPCIELATQAEIEEEEREREAEKLLAEQDKATDAEKPVEKKENVEEVVTVGDDLDLIVVEEKTEEKKEKPRCFRISKQEVRTVGFDFSTVKNLDALQVLEFSQYGKLLTGGKPIMVNEENDLRKRKLALSKNNNSNNDIQMGGSFVLKEEDEDEEHELPRQDQMLQSLSSFHRVDLNYSKEPHAPYFMCFLLKFKDISGEEEGLDYSLIPEKQINAFRLWNVDEKVDMSIAKMRNVYNVDGSTDALEVFNCHQHANLAVIAYRGGQRDEWFIEVLDEIIEFQSPARKYLRSILQKCQFDISEPSNDIFRVPSKETTSVSKDFVKDNRDLVLGFGVVGSGGQKHILNAEVELYDHFGRYIGKVFDGYSDMDAKLKHRPINFLTIYTQDDEEQFDVRVRDLVESSTVKYIVANIEVKSRSVLNENSQVYCRVVGMRTGQEIIRVQTAGSVFLDKYTKKEEKYEVNEDGYDSADESDNDIIVTMCVIELYKGGWKIVGCGEKNIVNLIPKYISPKPEGLKMEVSRGRNLLPVDHGSADPYLRVKLNEKNTRKGSKKQKVRTKIVNRTVNPDWHESHTIHIFDYEDYLIVKCMDYQKTRDQYMGEFRVKIGDLVRLHNIGRERRFILRDAEYWKAKEGKLIGAKKDSALATPAMGEVYIKFSPCPASEVTIKK